MFHHGTVFNTALSPWRYLPYLIKKPFITTVLQGMIINLHRLYHWLSVLKLWWIEKESNLLPSPLQGDTLPVSYQSITLTTYLGGWWRNRTSCHYGGRFTADCQTILALLAPSILTFWGDVRESNPSLREPQSLVPPLHQHHHTRGFYMYVRTLTPLYYVTK